MSCSPFNRFQGCCSIRSREQKKPDVWNPLRGEPKRYSLIGSPCLGKRLGATDSMVSVLRMKLHTTSANRVVAASAAASCFSILMGSHSSSSSRSAIHWPRACWAPIFLASEAPTLSGSSITRTRGSFICSSTLTVMLSGPSTTTTTSRSVQVCKSALCTALRTIWGRFRDGMTALTLGVNCSTFPRKKFRRSASHPGR
jgi:hypothetical protein